MMEHELISPSAERASAEAYIARYGVTNRVITARVNRRIAGWWMKAQDPERVWHAGEIIKRVNRRIERAP